MSKILGKVDEVADICDYIQDSSIEKYKTDNKKTTWSDVIKTINLTSLHLSETVSDYIVKDEIYITKNPLRKYTFISVPEYKNEKRIIRFPSLVAKEEYKREILFFVGCILSCYKSDKEDFFEIPGEFDDVLPLFLDYLYLADTNNKENFSLKYLDKIKNYTKYYKEYTNEYKAFYEYTRDISFGDFVDKGYQRYLKDCKKKDDELSKFTMENIRSLSSLDAVLQLIDKNLNSDEIKEIVEELMLNKNDNRKYVLNDLGINVEGYKRLKKEVVKYI